MFADFGCRYAMVGHSERRQHYGETDALVAGRRWRHWTAGLTPVACVGETLAEREAGNDAAVVLRQFEAVIWRLGVV